MKDRHAFLRAARR